MTFIGIAAGFLIAPHAFAGSATLTWNQNTESDLAGYNVYYDTVSHTGNCPTGFGTNAIDVGKVTSYTLNNLTGGQTYYFQIAAYDTSKNVSVCSAQVTKTVAVTADVTAPITTASPIGGSFAAAQTVILTANEPAIIYYTLDGTTPTTASAIYSAPLSIASTKTLRYFAKDTAGNNEVVKTQTYTINTTTVDATAPTIAVASPIAGTTVSGIIAPSANASDNIGVVGVQFKLDGNNVGSEITAAPYTLSYNTTQVANGTHTITATARDAANNQTTASAVSVTVANTIPTTATLSAILATTPLVGTAPLKGVSLKATVSGTQTGTINYTFYCNRSDTGTTITTPYSYKVSATTATSTTASKICTYLNPGTFTPKVIVERGTFQAQSQSTMKVAQPTTSIKFVLNQRVYVSSGPLNIRSSASTSGTLLGTQALRAKGSIIGGPVFADGYWWWNINFDAGVDGWAVENYLRKL